MIAPRHELHARGRVLTLGGLGERPALMGIVNATPDSFSDGPGERTLEARMGRARELIAAGARIIDVGGESNVTNRPAVDAERGDRARRAGGRAVARWRRTSLVSVDTYKPAVAEAAVAAGASIVNDISGLRDPGSRTSARAPAPRSSSCTRARRRSKRCWTPALYDDVVADVVAFLRERMDVAASSAASPRSRSSSTRARTSPRRPAQTHRGPARAWTSCTCSSARCCSRSPARTALGALTGRAPARAPRRARSPRSADGADRGAHIVRVHDVREAADFLAVRAALRGQIEVQRDLHAARAAAPRWRHPTDPGG